MITAQCISPLLSLRLSLLFLAPLTRRYGNYGETDKLSGSYIKTLTVAPAIRLVVIGGRKSRRSNGSCKRACDYLKKIDIFEVLVYFILYPLKGAYPKNPDLRA